MRQNRGCDPHVIINDVFLCETCGGIENLLQIRQLEIPALNFNGRVDHVISAQSLCLKASCTQNTALFLNQNPKAARHSRLPAFDNGPAAHVLSNFCPAGPSNLCLLAEGSLSHRRSDETPHSKVSRSLTSPFGRRPGPGRRLLRKARDRQKASQRSDVAC